MRDQAKGSAILLLATLIWGISLVAQSFGMSFVSPFFFNAARFIVGAVILVPIFLLSRKVPSHHSSEMPVKRELATGALCGSVVFVGASLQQVGIVFSTVGKTGFLTSLYILLVPLLGLFLGRRVGWHHWLCIAISLVGLYLLCVSDSMGLSLGDTLVLLCAVTSAVHILIIGKVAQQVDALRFCCTQFLVCGILSLVTACMFEEVCLTDLEAALYPILYTGILSCGVAYTMQTIAQRYISPMVTALLLSFEAVFAVFFAWVFLGENLGQKELAGCIVLFSAILFAQMVDILHSRTRKKVSEKEACATSSADPAGTSSNEALPDPTYCPSGEGPEDPLSSAVLNQKEEHFREHEY